MKINITIECDTLGEFGGHLSEIKRQLKKAAKLHWVENAARQSVDMPPVEVSVVLQAMNLVRDESKWVKVEEIREVVKESKGLFVCGIFNNEYLYGYVFYSTFSGFHSLKEGFTISHFMIPTPPKL